jgi:hypothetical protein
VRGLFSLLARLILRAVARLPDHRIRRLVRLLFARTTRELEAATRDVEGAQRARLLSIVGANADTVYGRDHGFADVESVDDFRERVPISTWDDYADLVERQVAGEDRVLTAERPIFYATTSGTTGRRKLIPVTSAYVAECRVTNRVLFRTSLLEMPGLLRGKRLGMRSPGTEDLGQGARAGSITVALSSGFEENESMLDAVPAAVYRAKGFAERYWLCLRFALQEDVRVVSAVNPSTLLLFAQTLEERAEQLAADVEAGRLGDMAIDDELRAVLEPRVIAAPEVAARIRASVAEHGFARMCDVFENLSGLVCWKGGSAPWYLRRLARSYGEDVPVLDYGYAASEGMFGAPLSSEGAASVLVPHGHFLELMPEEDVDRCRAGELPTTLLHEAQPGRRYYVVVTTGAGLYRYDMNDVVEIVGRHNLAPLAVFRHKGGNMSSLTGEKLGESHVVRAMDRATRDGPDLEGFVLAPVLPDDDEAPSYVLAVDVAAPLDDDAAAGLAARFDEALMEENEEYEAKRRSLRLAAASVVSLPAGAVARHREARVAAGAPDAHVKVPHLSPDGALLLSLGIEETAAGVAEALPARRTPA